MGSFQKQLDKESDEMLVNASNGQIGDSKKTKIYFWEKWALKPEDERHDKLSFYEVEDDINIREVIRNFENKIIGKKKLFSEISTKNSSVKKWINTIRESYPERKDNEVEDVLNTFRESLYQRSKEKYRYIVGILVLNDILILVHCKKDPSLAEFEDKIYPVKLILHPKNVLRAAIIRNENGKITFSAFEYSRAWSKGHAEFWEIEPEDISWDSLGSLILTVELDVFPYPIQLHIETEDLDEIIKNGNISPTGNIKIGRESGKITKAEIFRKQMDFPEFYDFYITEKEKLEEHKSMFKKIVFTPLLAYDKDSRDKYKYEEDSDRISEITSEGNKSIYDKKHPRYTICFFTKCDPGIKIAGKFGNLLYQSIFENKRMEIWHAGEESSLEPIGIGNLTLYNKMETNRELDEFSNRLLNLIQDSKSNKESLLLQYHFCNLWNYNIKNKHLGFLFDYIRNSIIIPELEFEFKNEGIFAKEKTLEFKSADDVSAKTNRFAKDTLVPTIRKYIEDGKLTRFCILYGIEDNGEIKPIYHLKNDMAADIEKKVNEELLSEKIKSVVHPIPFKDGIILSVFMIPLYS